MSGSTVNLIIQLVAGAAGGNLAGSLLKQYKLGTLRNSIACLVRRRPRAHRRTPIRARGGLAGQLLSLLIGSGAPGGGMDVGSLVAQVAGGGVGGGILLVLVGL